MEKPKYAMVKGSNFWFFQFHVSLPDTDSGKLHIIMGYGDQSLFGLFMVVYNFLFMAPSELYLALFISVWSL